LISIELTSANWPIPAKLGEEQARDIIAKAKPIYHLMGGLHSAETGPPEMLMELAYRLATEDSPVINQIRDNVIVTITPVAEPDAEIVMWIGTTATKLMRRPKRTAWAARHTGASTSFTTTIVT
jgi:hypothetical protein